MEKDEPLPKCRRQIVASAPQLVEAEEIDVGDDCVDEDERDHAKDVGWRLYQRKLLEIGSGCIGFAGREKAEREENEIGEDGVEACLVDVVAKDTGDDECE